MLSKLPRVLLDVVTAVSLSLLVATVSMWTGSYAGRSGLVLYQNADPPPAVGAGRPLPYYEYRRSASVSAGRFRVVGYQWSPPRPERRRDSVRSGPTRHEPPALASPGTGRRPTGD